MFEPPKGRHRVEPNTAKHLTLDTEIDASAKPEQPTQNAAQPVQVDQQGMMSVHFPFLSIFTS